MSTGSPPRTLCLLAHDELPEPVVLLARALALEFERLGHEVVVAHDGIPVDGDVACVLLDPWRQRHLTGLDVGADPTLTARSIVVLVDADTGDAGAMAWLDSTAGVLSTSPEAIGALGSAGVDADLLIPGRAAAWSEAGRDRDLAVAFAGSWSARRVEVLGRCASTVWSRDSSFTFDDGHLPFLDRPHPPLLDLLGRSEVALEIATSDAHEFDLLRAAIAMHRGAVVVADREPSSRSGLTAGVHLLCEPDDLPGAMATALDEHERRGLVRKAAAEWLDAYPLVHAAGEIVRIARAIPDVDPVRSDRLPAPRTPGLPEIQPPDVAQDDETGLVRRQLKEVRLELLDLRRAQQRSSLAMDGGRDPADIGRTETVWTSPAHAAATPRVSVLTAVYDHADVVTSAVASAAATVGVDIEIVAVDDGSADDTADAVIAEATRHDGLALTLLRHPVNRGLGPARNTALDHARGEFVFVLDADNTVRPNGIARLAAALDATPSAAAAYGMLERFDEHGPVGVGGEFAWSPRRLRGGNYIDAMALFRTEVVRSVGGYTTERRLYGWEDYDLWCALAEAGHDVVRVPNFVARYRVSAQSMITLSDLSHTAAYEVLIERHPRLMHGVVPPR